MEQSAWEAASAEVPPDERTVATGRYSSASRLISHAQLFTTIFVRNIRPDKKNLRVVYDSPNVQRQINPPGGRMNAGGLFTTLLGQNRK